jgi:hypothetical protein
VDSIYERWARVRAIEDTLPADPIWLFPLNHNNGVAHLCEAANRRAAAISLLNRDARIATAGEVAVYLRRVQIRAAESLAIEEARVTGFSVGGPAWQK